jgi:hypothetical protein
VLKIMKTKTQLKKLRKAKNLTRAKRHRQKATVYTEANSGHWHRRVIREMKQSERVINRVINGELDSWLDKSIPNV